MQKRIILSLAVVAAAVLPAAAHAAGTTFTGVVVAKEANRGTLVVASRSGAARTVHVRLSAARLGDRISVGGTKLRDGTFRAGNLRVIGHARSATVQGVVVRRLAARTLVSTGASVIAIQRRAAKRSLASRGLTPGTVARFGVSISGGRVRETSVSALSLASTVQVEGKVVTLSPFVVNVKGLPITIGLGSVALPPTLAAGDEVEVTVNVDGNNAFTLVSVDSFNSEAEPGDDQGDDNGQPGQGQEVEVEGTVVSSSGSQIVVADKAGNQTTFVAGAGMTLPILATGTRVEAKGMRAGTVVTLVKLEVKGQDDDGGGSGSSGDDNPGSADGGGSGSGGDGGGGSGGGGGSDD